MERVCTNLTLTFEALHHLNLLNNLLNYPSPPLPSQSGLLNVSNITYAVLSYKKKAVTEICSIII